MHGPGAFADDVNNGPVFFCIRQPSKQGFSNAVSRPDPAALNHKDLRGKLQMMFQQIFFKRQKIRRQVTRIHNGVGVQTIGYNNLHLIGIASFCL